MAEKMDTRRENEEKDNKGWISLIIRFIVAAIVLMVTAFLTPGFTRMGFGTAIIAALVIAALDYIIQKLFKIDVSPLGRGLVGFITAAIVVYVTQFFVPNMEITLLGAVIAALIIGIIDAIIPTHVM